MPDMDISKLFDPLAIKSVTLPNRFVMPPMQRGWSRDGVPDEALANYYRARVIGGAGLIIGESAAIPHPSANGQAAAVNICGDAIPAWSRIVGAVKDAGGHMLLQLWHEGSMRRQHSGGSHPDAATLGPSGLVWKGRANGRPASHDELNRIRDAYVEAALTARAMGADGVELHAAHGFLLDQFCWYETNIRDDEFGGSLMSRFAFPLSVVRAIRAAVGEAFLIGWRFSQWKEVDFGAHVFETPAELAVALKALEAAGVDMLHASTRRYYTPEWPGSDLGLAGWASTSCSLPVIGIGSVGVRHTLFTDEERSADPPDHGLDELVRRFDRGDFALVGVGRAMIADADFVNKIRAGRASEIRPFSREMLGEDVWDLSLAMEGLSRFGNLH